MRGGFGRRISSGDEEDFSLKELDKRALKFLFKYLKAHIKTLIIATLCMLMVTLATLAGPYLSKIAIDSYITKGDLRGLNWIFILMLISYGVLWLFSYFQTYLSNWIGQRIVGDIREDLYQHLQNLTIDFFHKRDTGDIMSRVTHDVNALSDLISTGYVHLLNDFFTLLGIVIIMLFLNVQLALVSFMTIPFIFFVVSFLGKRMRKAYQGVREKLAELNADVEQNLSGIRLIQALNREARNTGEFKQLSWENLKANLKAASYFSLLFPVMNLSKVLGEALVLGYGGWGVVRGTISIGVIIAFMGYVRRFFAPLADLSQVYNTYQSAGAALDRIYEYMSIEPSLKELNNPQLPEKVKGEIEFKGVSFAYEKENVIEDLNFKINSGEVMALVGPTGAGKTTIVNLLTRLYDVDQGQILIDGVDVRELSFEFLRKNISVVSQDVFLFDTSIKNNIRYGKPEAEEKEIIEVARQIQAHGFIKDLPQGYETRVGEGGVKLSGGQKQLISFARAMLTDPQILILDEATSSVDAYTEVMIQEAMDKLLENRTVLMIAHRFATLKKAGRIGVLKDGKMIGLDTHQKLVKENKVYRKLVNKQINNKYLFTVYKKLRCISCS
ncbi:MAG: ABC transporter ATP-binding protein [Halanaerobiales bacterium]